MQFLQSEGFRSSFEIHSDSGSDQRELAPGVVLERRVMLGHSLGLLAAICTFGPKFAVGQDANKKTSDEPDYESLQLETLISGLRPASRRLVDSAMPDEESYIQLAIKELEKVTRLDTNRFVPSHKPGWEMDIQAFVPPLLLYQIRMSPNSVIELHDHRHHNGALSIREGSVRVRSFDLYQEPGKERWDVVAGKVPEMNEAFLIQEKDESRLKQGQSIGLTRTRDNIHQIEAGPDGCLMYDLFTNFKMNAQSFEIKWDGKYFDTKNKLCKVVWIPPDHTHE